VPDVVPPAVPAPVGDPVTEALRKRASDADREKVAGLLRDAYAEGRLSPVEHEERLSEVYRAPTYAELVPVLHDLPIPPGSFTIPGAAPLLPAVPAPASVAVPTSGALVVDPSLAGQALGPAVAIFSGVERKGRWVVPSSQACVAVFGGIELDLTEAVLTAQETSIQVFALMGGIEITVPEGVAVRAEAIGFMGGTSSPTGEVPEGAPVLRIQGVAIMGGVDVKRPKQKRRRLGT